MRRTLLIAITLLADAMTYCDMTTGPDGDPVTVEVRLAEILARYGEDSIVPESIREARPRIVAAANEVAAMVRDHRR